MIDTIATRIVEPLCAAINRLASALEAKPLVRVQLPDGNGAPVPAPTAVQEIIEAAGGDLEPAKAVADKPARRGRKAAAAPPAPEEPAAPPPVVEDTDTLRNRLRDGIYLCITADTVRRSGPVLATAVRTKLLELDPDCGGKQSRLKPEMLSEALEWLTGFMEENGVK